MFSPARRADAGAHRCMTSRCSAAISTPTGCNGIDNEWLTPAQAKAFCPPLNIAPGMRYPVLGAALQRRGGAARHDAVAWGYARAADALGVDIVQNCAVTGITRDANGAVDRRAKPRAGRSPRRKIGVVAAGHTSVVMAMAGLRMPLESYPAAGAGQRASEAGVSLRGDVQCRACLYQPVRQGRTGDRRRHRRLYFLQPGRRPAVAPTRWRRSASCFPPSAACACCATGAASSMSRRTARPSSAARRCRACS